MRVRQPLAVLYARVHSDAERESVARLADQVQDELNVQRLELLPPESDMLLYTIQPRMPVLGPKHGKLLPKVLAALRTGDMQAKARTLLDTGRLPLVVEGQAMELTPDEVTVEASARAGFVAAEDKGYVVVLDTTLTPELIAEGLARDLTHFIQDVRKRAGFAIEDTITTTLATDAELAAVVERHRAYIQDETLTRELRVVTDGVNGATPAGAYREAISAAKLGGHEVVVTVAKHGA